MNSVYLTDETPKTNAERLDDWRKKRGSKKSLQQSLEELEAELERFNSMYKQKVYVPGL